MKIVVCYKAVPDLENLKIRPDGTLDFDSAAWEIGPYDLNAVEAGVTLAEQNPGSEVVALTAGGKVLDDTKLRKAILARGPDKLCAVRCETAAQADTYAVASVLAEAVRNMGDVDLVLFGEGSGDLYSQQTGSLVGALLGWNTLNSVGALALEEGQLRLSRETESGTEQYAVALPAVLSVTSDINVPRIANMKAILSAGKKPVEILSRESFPENRTFTESILAPKKAERRQQVQEKPDEGALAALCDTLKKQM